MNLATLLILSLTAGQQPEPSMSAMVLDVTGDPAEAAEQITAMVADAVRKQPNLAVIAETDYRKLLGAGATEEFLKCQQDPGCIARLAEPLNAGLLVTGSIAKTSRSYVLNLALIDREAAYTINRVGATAREVDLMKAAIDEAVARLFEKGKTKRASLALSPEKVSSFAVLDFEVSGGDPAASKGLGNSLTQALSQELKRIDGVSVINRDDIVKLIGIEKMRRVLDEDCDANCFIRIGDSLNTDYVVIGQVAELGGSYFVSVTLLDKKAASLADGVQVTESFRGTDEELVRAIRHIGRTVVGASDDAVGSVVVQGPRVSEAAVAVDQLDLGQLPLAIDKRRLKPGRHSLVLKKAGFLDWHSDFYILPGETSELWAEVREEPQAWYQKWWVWTVVGVAVAGGVTGAVVASQSAPETGSGTVTIE